MATSFDSSRRWVRASGACALAVLCAAVLPVSAQNSPIKPRTTTSAKATASKPTASKPTASKPTPAKASAARSTTTARKSTARSRTSSYSAASSRARKARLASARAAAQLALPRFKLDEQGSVVPDIRAEAAIIYNPSTGQVLWAENAHDQRSIASITKVMTAVCFVESNPDYTQEVFIEPADVRGANTTYLRAYERVSVRDLLHLLLIASDNAAARVLARVSSYGAQGFVVRMNEKAVELGLTSTRYADPSGLLSDNVSSAYDMARLITYTGDDEFISSVMRTSEYTFRTSKRPLRIHSTNQLLRMPQFDVRGGKTGFISRAGYCLATLLRLPEMNQTVAVVVLGAKSNSGRFWETRHLFNWIATRGKSFQGIVDRESDPPSPPIDPALRGDRH